MVGVARLFHFALCSFWLVTGLDAWRLGGFGPEGQLCSALVLLVTMLFALCSLLSMTGRVSWHLGRHGPEGLVCCVVEAALDASFDSGIVLAGFAGFVQRFPSVVLKMPKHALRSGPEGQFYCEILASRSSPLVSGSHVQCLPRRRHTGIGFSWGLMTSMMFLCTAQWLSPVVHALDQRFTELFVEVALQIVRTLISMALLRSYEFTASHWSVSVA